PEDEEQGLDVSRTSFAKARLVLKPLPAELMDAHDVSPIVNSAKYDGPECIQPVSDDEYLVAVNYPCCNYNHLMTLSARISTNGGIVRPRSSAVLRLITSSNFVGCSTGRSAGLTPIRILST